MRWNALVKKKYPLIFLGILIFLVFTIAILSLTLNYVKLNQESALRALEEQVKSGSEQLQFYFSSLRSDLLRIERYLANTNMKVDEELYRYLDFVKGLRPNAIPAILILDANGNAVANTNPALVRVNFWKSECFKNIQHTPNRIYLTEAIVLSDLSGRSEAPSKIFEDSLNIGFVLCTDVYSKGKFKGAVVFVLRGEPFFDQYSIAIAEPASGYEFILQEDGRILLHREVELRGKFLSELPESSDLTEADHLLKKTEGKTIAHSAVGEHMTVTA
ncbi:MAG: cache domain-containing protein, partial [Deltaproteobacteria bacterium]|nr:cache domain-containing protein [Deltaproteobacteria bacterium]